MDTHALCLARSTAFINLRVENEIFFQSTEERFPSEREIAASISQIIEGQLNAYRDDLLYSVLKSTNAAQQQSSAVRYS
jgi:hypothetical protein